MRPLLACIALLSFIPAHAEAMPLRTCLVSETGKIVVKRRCSVKRGQVEINAGLLQGLGASQVGPQGPAGPQGVQGPQGEQGLDGAEGSRGPSDAIERVAVGGPLTNCPSLSACADFHSMMLPAGNWLVSAKFVVDNNGNADSSSSNRCGLFRDGVQVDESRFQLSPNTTGGQNTVIVLSRLVADVLDGAVVSLRCTQQAGESLVYEDSTLSAIQVENAIFQ